MTANADQGVDGPKSDHEGQVNLARPSVSRWDRLSNPNSVGLLFSVVLALVLRLFELKMPSSPDSFHKWDIVRELTSGHLQPALSFDHHAARWAVNLPIAFAQLILGKAPVVAYVPILVFDLLQAALTYWVGVLLGSRAIGVLAVILFSIVPQMNYVGSELLPSVFESAYVLAACYGLLRAFDGPGRRWVYVSLACACLAYLAKETTVFYFPGLLLGYYLARRRLMDCVVFTAGFFSFVALETMFYRVVFGFPLGRLSIIAGHHLGNAKLKVPIRSLGQLFERYLQLSSGVRELFYAALVVGVLYPLWRRWRDAPPAETSPRLNHEPYLLMLLTTWSYFFFTTFALKSLHPVQLAQPASERYLLCALPFLALTLSGFAVHASRRPLARIPSKLQPALLVGFCSLLALLSLRGHGHRWSANPLVLTPRFTKTLRTAFDEGIPIVGPDDHATATKAVAFMFLDQQRLPNLKCLRLVGKSRSASKGARASTEFNGRYVCVNLADKQFHGLDDAALRSKLESWSSDKHVLVTSRGGFRANPRSPSKDAKSKA
ncbi:MAG TPA: glycosyltransferase family 39 protein [Polyangiaceae bacterium]|nr:glycosyltransferase family 39 protein [Polyangiaceae bacterium]